MASEFAPQRVQRSHVDVHDCTRAPSPTKARAISRPMPDAPAVISTFLHGGIVPGTGTPGLDHGYSIIPSLAGMPGARRG